MNTAVFLRKILGFRSTWLFAAVIALLLTGSLTACRNQVESSSSPVLLQIDDRRITLDEFNRRFARTLPPDHTLAQNEKEELRRSFLRQVIDRELALAEAQRLGITIEPQEVDAALVEMRRNYPNGNFDQMLSRRGITLEQVRADLAERLIIDRVLARAVYEKISIDPEEIADYYAAHRDEFVRPQRVRARQILVDSQEQGQEILERLHNGASFTEMAERFSLSPDSAHGGDLGLFPRGEMPAEFDEVVFKLPPGQLSSLIESEYGYHIFQVDEVQPAQDLSLEEASEEIRSRLRRQQEEDSRRSWLLELGARAELEVNWPLL